MACKAIQGFLYVFFDTQLSDVIKEKMKRLSVRLFANGNTQA